MRIIKLFIMKNRGSIVPLEEKTRELYKDYDLSLQDKEVLNNRYLNGLVESELKEFSDKWFVEYSVLATTIDPLRTSGDSGKLKCFSFIKDNGKDDETFKGKIEKYISPIISVLKDKAKNNNWWFHNPETFLAPTQINPYISFTNGQIIDKSKGSPGYDIITRAKDNESDIKEKGGYKEGGKSFYYSSLEYERTFGDILTFAKDIYNAHANKPDADLIEHYRNGVEEARLYYDNFIANEGEEFCYLTFPIVASSARLNTPDIYKKTFGENFLKNRYQGLGHCFIYFNIKDPDSCNKEELKRKIASLFQQVNITLHNFAFNYTFNLGLYLQENARKEAMKSAISAIMSRNMSHNLGSHYIYYTKDYLDKLANTVEDISPDIRGTVKVLEYVQARMDYLATVISNDKYPYGAVNFKSQIYDVLTVDDFSHRHFPDEKDKPKRITNFLLRNLIFSENFSRPDVRSDEELLNKENQLFLHVKLLESNHNYGNFTGTWHSGKLDWVDDKLDEDPDFPTMTAEEIIKNKLSALNIALPGGSMSCHALFNVIENFIRNSAKYLQNDANKEEGLICTLALKPNKDNRYIDITIYDNKRNASKYADKYNLYRDTEDFSNELEKLINTLDRYTKQEESVAIIIEILKRNLKSINNGLAKAHEIIDEQQKNKKITSDITSCNLPNIKGVEDEMVGYFESVLTCLEKNKQVFQETDSMLYDVFPLKTKSIRDKWKQPSLFEQIIEKLSSLIIIDEQNRISKEDKGFKEMLFSSTWMRAYTFGSNMTYADVISNINNAPNGEDKISLIEKHGFSIVKVREIDGDNILIYKRKDNFDGESNLGLQITLPLFKLSDEISITGDRSVDVDRILNMMSDIEEVDEDYFASKDYHHVFTRPLLKETSKRLSEYEKFHKVVANRFPDIDKYSLNLGIAEEKYKTTPKDHQIFFKRHMSTSGNADPDEYKGYAYADTVSGGNFTITLLDLFNKGYDYENGVYKSEDDKIFALKIKESALTRITIIDERLFKSTNIKDYPWLSLKNIRVLNYNDCYDHKVKEDTKEYDISNIFMGNNFCNGSETTHFLTIHLGLIEKILKNSEYVNKLIDIELGESQVDFNPLDSMRVKTFMKILREKYSDGNIRDIFIAVHSGRGNYSAELEGPLSKYPFISLSALENAFNNSKFQLSQLLYNTVYIGKGFANNI